MLSTIDLSGRCYGQDGEGGGSEMERRDQCYSV